MASEASEPEHLNDGETVARSAIQPKFFAEGSFSELALLSPDRLDDKKVKKSRYGISVASKMLLRSDAEIHAYGCRTAQAKNDRFTVNKDREPQIDERNFYRGFYDMPVGIVLSAASEAYAIEVVHIPENGEDAHCEIRLLPNMNVSVGDLKDARTDLLIELGKTLNGPEEHLCEVDADYATSLRTTPLPRLTRLTRDKDV